ncbi:non-oxidative hydroxyarylic acid decarboxylases subunit D [Sciscionella marina]|uniref:non-oxidative hydroxyarylic acid decarboxylases subunit D n=1 Tax=Sciscionella marina TaxID=508770 RepID=UPI001F0978EA|nr:non-oxidative hydroxyarylic acid decarboxylases subunit D [Sciscionella marina]
MVHEDEPGRRSGEHPGSPGALPRSRFPAGRDREQAEQKIERLAVSPVPGAGEVYCRARCGYSPRSTDPDQYPERFRLTAEELAAAIEVPAIPPLRSRS